MKKFKNHPVKPYLTILSKDEYNIYQLKTVKSNEEEK
jgi:hypothetical protein